MELTDVLRSLRRHWKFSVGVMIIAVVAGVVFLQTRKTVRPPDKYRAGVDILIPATDSKGQRPEGVPGSLLRGQAQLALSPDTEQAALDSAHVPDSQRSGISFGFNETSANPTTSGSQGCTGSCSDVVSLTVTASNANTATAVANAFGDAYINARRQVVGNDALSQQRNNANGIAVLNRNLADINAKIAQADPALPRLLPKGPAGSAPTNSGGSNSSRANSSPSGIGSAAVVSLLPPDTPEPVILLVVQRNALLTTIQGIRDQYGNSYINSLIPSSYADHLQSHTAAKVTPPPPSGTIPLAAFLGVGLALALLVPLLRDRLDRSIRSPRVAADALDATVLTVLPPSTRRLTHSLAPPGSEIEEAYRSLAATAVATDRLPKAIVVTSPTGTLQDMVAANFGAALANLGLRVALVATDARQTWFMNGEAPEGNLSFEDVLHLAHKGQLNGALSRALVRSEVDNLYVLPSQSEDGEVGLDGLRPLLEALSSSGIDIIVVAGPPLLEEPDATIFAWTTRSVLWTVEEGRTTEAEAKEAAARLELAGASAFGIVMVSARQA